MENLEGVMVLVDPNLKTDRAQRQGQIGLITGIDTANDVVKIQFNNERIEVYPAKSLLVMKPHTVLSQNIVTIGRDLNNANFKTMLLVNRLQEHFTAEKLREAIELTKTNRETLAFGTMSLPDRMKMQLVNVNHLDKLAGEMVLVHPNFDHDPANRQGQIGIITHIDIKKDEVLVGFGDQPLALYSADALLVLKPHNKLYKDILETGKHTLDKNEFGTALRINLLQESGSVAKLREAVEMSMTSPRVLEMSTKSLQDTISLLREQNMTEDRQLAYGR